MVNTVNTVKQLINLDCSPPFQLGFLYHLRGLRLTLATSPHCIKGILVQKLEKAQRNVCGGASLGSNPVVSLKSQACSPSCQGVHHHHFFIPLILEYCSRNFLPQGRTAPYCIFGQPYIVVGFFCPRVSLHHMIFIKYCKILQQDLLDLAPH